MESNFSNSLCLLLKVPDEEEDVESPPERRPSVT